MNNLYDRAWTFSLTSGTGTLTVSGNRLGYSDFTVIPNGTLIYYTISDPISGAYEVGSGVYSAGTLTRAQVYTSSNGNALVNFSTNSKDVFVTAPATLLNTLGASGSITSGQIANNAVVSGSIASGQICSFHMASGTTIGSGSIQSGFIGNSAVVSGSIASGQISQFALSSGAVNSGQINVANTPASGAYFRSDFTWSLPAGGGTTLTSGYVSSGYLGNASVVSGSIASGSISQFALSSGSVNSGQINLTGVPNTTNFLRGDFTWNQPSGVVTSGQIVSGKIGDNAVVSGSIASGQISHFHVASGTIGSGQLGITAGTPNGTLFLRDDFSWQAAGGGLSSGSVQSGNIGNNAVVSGSIASGQISTFVIASGTSVTRAQYSIPFDVNSPTAVTEEIISGVRAVCLSQSGNIRVAMASVSGRMPAVGIVHSNFASGVNANVYSVGNFQTTSGLADYSGYIGRLLYVGRSGHIVTASGSFNSGGLSSGDVTQTIGFAFNSGNILTEVSTMPYFVAGVITSGQVGSGQVGNPHLSANAVSSGQVASGNVTTFSRNVMLDDFVANETVSGTRPVCLSSGGGGTILMAQGASGLRMPAIGVNIDNALSGGPVRVVMFGKILMTSGMDAAFSGQIGQPLFVASSGHLITSVKPVSGTLTQRIGTGLSGGMIVSPGQMTSGNYFVSGDLTGWMN